MKMNKLTNIVVKSLRNSRYLKPLTVEYILNGKKRTCNVLKVHQGVSIILYNSTRNVMVFVKQFRPVIYLNRIPEKDITDHIDINKYPVELGVTVELCAGIVDKNIPLEQIAAEEIEEECNYKIDPSNLEKILTYRSEVTMQGTIQTLFYSEVTDDMKQQKTDKIEEEIEIVEMTIPEVRKFISQKDYCTTAIILYGINWFLNNKYKNKN